MKKSIIVRFASILMIVAVLLNGCGKTDVALEKTLSSHAIKPQKVVALSSSLAEIWLLAGGELVGTTSDTFERAFDNLPNDVAVVGTVKDPSLEAILNLEPDFIILNAEIAGHTKLEQALKDAEIACCMVSVSTFSDYLKLLNEFCIMNQSPENFIEHGTNVELQIESLINGYEASEVPRTYLLLRVHSSGGKVIAKDHTAIDILNDLELVNVAEKNQGLLSDLSLEGILESNPDYIFVVTMGEESAAMLSLEQMFTSQPAWNTLSAVQDEKVIVLPKELFHHKPNAKWGEAYEFFIRLLTE